MNSHIVIELQQNALDSSVKVSDLLRKASVVARKLNIKEFENWLTHELNGYEDNDKIPNYRKLKGEVKVWNPYRGWQPVSFDNNQTEEIMTYRFTKQSISELEALIDSKPEQVTMKFPSETELSLMKNIRSLTPPILHLSIPQIFSVTDRVRNIILDWSLKLEENGILGDGLTFSKEEKQIASQIVYNVTTNIYGNMENSNIQQNSSDSNLSSSK